MTYYLRVEGTNFAYTTEDTKDLSTIRGGSLMMLDAPDQLTALPGQKLVTRGASIAIYEFEAADSRAAEAQRTAVEDQLNQGLSRHGTFVVDVAVKNGDETFARDREILVAKNRFRQMRSPSMAWPQSPNDLPNGVCVYDGVRPVTDTVRKGDDTFRVSQSVKDRHEYGKNGKRRFFVERLKMENPPTFVYELQELAGDESKGNLNRKMAVIHIDGDKFGKALKTCETVELLRAFDKKVQDSRINWLREHIENTRNSGDWTTTDGNYRLEVLLWGGDDILLVVPAWQGWAMLRSFFTATAAPDLTHSAGMVFCNQKAPIHSVSSLAGRLTSEAKGPGGRFSYQMLESFDTLGSEFDDKRKALCPPGSIREALSLDGREMEAIESNFKAVREKIARRKLHEVARTLLRRQPEAAQLATDFEKAMDECKPEWTALKAALPEGNALYVHLNELWDYMPGEA